MNERRSLVYPVLCFILLVQDVGADVRTYDMCDIGCVFVLMKPALDYDNSPMLCVWFISIGLTFKSSW